MDNCPFSLFDIYNRKVDGLIIRNVVDANTITTLIDKVEDLGKERIIKISESLFTHPQSFAQVNTSYADKEKLINYSLDRKDFWREIAENFGFNLVEILKSSLKRISSEYDVCIPPGIDDNGFCNPLTLKILPKKMVGNI